MSTAIDALWYMWKVIRKQEASSNSHRINKIEEEITLLVFFEAVKTIEHNAKQKYK